jgi:hypothetical protein
MHLFLGWRPMGDRIGHLGHAIEVCLWGDSRARHTFLIASTDEYPLVMIEIDVGDNKKGIRKSMKLNLIELEELPNTVSQLEFIGEDKSVTALTDLIRSAQTYVHDHPFYHVLFNNCRTFVEYLIDQMQEFRDSIPRKNDSILEYHHAKAKHEHPGALIKSKKLLKTIRDLHRRNKIYKHMDLLVLDIQLSQLNTDKHIQTIQEQV